MSSTDRFEVSDTDQATSVLAKINAENALKFLHEPTDHNSEWREQYFVACSIPGTDLEYRTHENGKITYWKPKQLLKLLVSERGMAEFAPADQLSITK